MLVCILADTRVGSTALGSGITSDIEVHFHGEILYPELSDREDHLYSRLVGWKVGDAANIDELYKRLDEYFIPMARDAVIHIVDVKYHDLHLVPIHPSPLLSCPSLLTYIMNRNFPLIHLNRRNKLAAHLSEIAAQHRTVHHAKQDAFLDQPAPTKASLVLYDAVVAIEQREHVHRLVSSWLIDYSNVLETDYEAVLVDPLGASLLASFAQDQWGIEISLRPVLRRMSMARDVLFSNWSELRRVVAPTRWFIDLEELASLYDPGAVTDE